MNFLVTGGAGFIGSNIVEHLLEMGENVTILDNFSTGRRSNIAELVKHKKCKLIEGDIRSYHIVRSAVENVDYILHQGALPSVPRSVNDPLTTNEVNIVGTLNVLQAAKETNVKRLVFASSSSIYGDSEELPKHTDMRINPLSPYALSKYTGERYCQMFYNLYGFETVCLRYFNVFGPKQDPTSQYSAVIPKFITAIMEDEKPTIYGDGTQSRDFTFIENVVSANIKACFAKNAPGNVMNIACNDRITLVELVDKINIILGKAIEPDFSSPRLGDIKHSYASIEKAKKLIDYEVKKDFSHGLEETIDHFKI
ncbi:MAG: SDR family oxidoreductase [Candidatus Cloacimonadota bacterium]|nr:SDR family oxidoreductase [Candidatus Cloacimonadota bacterium]